MPTRVLLTGFEPFGGDAVNASGEAVRLLAESFDDPAIELITAILPVSFRGGPVAVRALILEHHPDAVIAVGEAGGRGAVTPELWAVNEAVARIPDNDGQCPEGVLDEGPERLATRLDVPALVTAIDAVGVPAELSADAGRFVCNAVFRTVLTGSDVPAGFIHVPALRSSGTAGVGAETDPEGGVRADRVATSLPGPGVGQEEAGAGGVPEGGSPAVKEAPPVWASLTMGQLSLEDLAAALEAAVRTVAAGCAQPTVP